MAYSQWQLLGGLFFLGREETFWVFEGKLSAEGLYWRDTLSFLKYAASRACHTLSTPILLWDSNDRIIFLWIKLSTNIRKHFSKSLWSCIIVPQSPSILSGLYANIAIKPQLALFTRPSHLINVPTIQQPKHPSRKEVPLCLITAEMKF